MVSGREIQRFFSPHSVLHGFVFYAADRELPEEPPKELTEEFPEELLKEPLEELPEMRQVGLELTILAVSLVNVAILAASMADREDSEFNFVIPK